MEQSFSEDTFKKFQRFLIAESGLYFATDRASLLAEKVKERMIHSGHKNYDAYFNYISLNGEGGEEKAAFFEHLTIGETYFFRNAPHFDALRQYVMPDLLSRKKDRMLKIWCAGCSTGEEPYSIAIFLRETILDLDSWHLSILATDINRQSLAMAQKGLFSKRSVSQSSPSVLEQYFVQKANHYELIDRIKNMVTFRKHNLIADPFSWEEMREVDILFCRNVTIYFNLETLKKLMERFAACVTEKGYLFIGHAETLWNISTDFKAVEFPHTFIYQKASGEPKEQNPPPLPIPIPTFNKCLGLERAAERSSGHVQKSALSNRQKEVDSCEVLMNQATELANQESYQASLEILVKILKQDNLYTPAYYLKGVLHTKQNSFEEATQEFKRLLYADPGLVMGYFHLANLYRQLGAFALAQKEYQNGIKVLAQADEANEVPFSEGLTVGIMRQAMTQGLEAVSGGSRNGHG